jgi:hypothetical protein
LFSRFRIGPFDTSEAVLPAIAFYWFGEEKPRRAFGVVERRPPLGFGGGRGNVFFLCVWRMEKRAAFVFRKGFWV